MAAVEQNHQPVVLPPVLGQGADHPDGIHRIRPGTRLPGQASLVFCEGQEGDPEALQ